MTSPPPRLITFGISHYCEKARWALDWHGIACEERSWPPAVHIPLARLTGAKRSTLPILAVGDRVIQGSGEIIDWAERNADGAAPALSPQGDARDATAIKRRADHVIGPQVRRLFYAKMLPRHHRMVKPALAVDVARWHEGPIFKWVRSLYMTNRTSR